MLFFQSSLSTLARARNKDSRFQKRGREGGRKGGREGGRERGERGERGLGEDIVVQKSEEKEGRQGLESSSKYVSCTTTELYHKVSQYVWLLYS